MFSLHKEINVSENVGMYCTFKTTNTILTNQIYLLNKKNTKILIYC